LLTPAIGTERTLLLGGALNGALGLLLLAQVWRPAAGVKVASAKFIPRKQALVAAFAGILILLFAVPSWDMAAMTAGAYKYAPYYAASDASQLDRGDLVFLKEGVSGTVAVRKEAGSTILSIDGKVDASDAGGDLLTEKLLAHLPLLLAGDAQRVCLIGL